MKNAKEAFCEPPNAVLFHFDTINENAQLVKRSGLRSDKKKPCRCKPSVQFRTRLANGRFLTQYQRKLQSLYD